MEEAMEKTNQQWIPVEERLPKDFSVVWASCETDHGDPYVIECEYRLWNHFTPWGDNATIAAGNAKVVAWMPKTFPEPYKRDVETAETPAADAIIIEEISETIKRLKITRAYALTGFYTKGGDYKVIVTKEDKGYFKALEDIEKGLLGEEGKPENEMEAF